MFGYAGTAAICSLLGAAGYALYGSAVAPVVTASMPALSAVALGCTALTLANPFSAFALTLEPVAVAVQRRLWPAAVEPPRYVARAAIRLGEGRHPALLSTVAASGVPHTPLSTHRATTPPHCCLPQRWVQHAVLLGWHCRTSRILWGLWARS